MPGSERLSGGPVGRRTGWLRILLAMVLASLFAWLAFKGGGWKTVQGLFQADPWWLLAGLAALAGGYALRIIRWWLMLRRLSAEVACTDCVMPFLGSFALNNLLPLRAGDVVRTIAFCERLGVSLSGVLATMLIERLFDLFGLLVILIAAMVMLGSVDIPPLVVYAILATGGMVVAGLIVLLCASDALIRWTRHMVMIVLPPSLGQRMDGPLVTLADGLRLLRGWRFSALMSALSIGAWLAEGALFWSVCHALGLAVGASAWLGLGLANLATLIPSTPGHVGTFDYFLVLALGMGGVLRDQAQTAAVGIHLMVWMPVTVLGGLGLIFMHRRMTRKDPSHG